MRTAGGGECRTGTAPDDQPIDPTASGALHHTTRSSATEKGGRRVLLGVPGRFGSSVNGVIPPLFGRAGTSRDVKSMRRPPSRTARTPTMRGDAPLATDHVGQRAFEGTGKGRRPADGAADQPESDRGAGGAPGGRGAQGIGTFNPKVVGRRSRWARGSGEAERGFGGELPALPTGAGLRRDGPRRRRLAAPRPVRAPPPRR